MGIGHGWCSSILGEFNWKSRPTRHSSRRAAVRWPGASAPRFSATLRVALLGPKGRERLSERTLGGRNRGRHMSQPKPSHIPVREIAQQIVKRHSQRTA
jgi:hypothetical protein